MKTKAILPISLFLLSLFSLNAQVENFNLSDYKMPDVRNHLLDLDLSLFQSNTSNTQITSSNGERNRSIYTGSINSSYQGFRNSPGWQKALTINNFSFYSKDDQSIPSSNSSSQSSSLISRTTINTIQRRYFKPNLFFEFNTNISNRFDKSKLKSKTSSSNSSRESTTNFVFGFIPLKTGIGRIENVSDARHAIFIIDALKKKNVINRNLSSEEITDFATQISQLKNRRFFDARLRKIAELKVLDSFLQSKDYLDQSNIEYYTSLNDLWTFGGTQIRQSGDRISLVVYPGMSYLSTKGTFSDPSETKTYNLHGGLEYIKEKPISHEWQNTFNSFLYLGIVKGTFNPINEFSEDKKIEIPKFNIGFSNTIGYYPNTRTSIEFKLSSHYDSFLNRIDNTEDQRGLDGERLYFTSDLDVQYFISPRFSVSINSSTLFLKSYTDIISIRDISSLSLASYPLCETLDCTEFENLKKSTQFNFRVSFEYSLF